MEGKQQRYLASIADELKDKTYKAMPVRGVYIPKADGSKRLLGIPTTAPWTQTAKAYGRR